jgi:hypothetical protein
MLALALVLTSSATEADCRRCCSEVGLGSCAPSLQLVGEQTMLIESGGTWRAEGMWILGCDGSAYFDEAASGFFEIEPVQAEVNTDGASKEFLKCFVQQCGFPPDVCPRSEAGRPVLRRCADGGVLTDHDLDPARPRPQPQAFESAAPTPSRPAVAQVTAPEPTPVFEPEPEPVYEPTPAAEPTPPPPTVVVREVQELGSGGAAQPLPSSSTQKPAHISLPPAPIPPCKTGAGEAKASRDQVDQGNEAEIRGDLAAAAGSYRAALTLDACNVHAWVAIGQLALRQQDPAQAIKALDSALLLRPDHYGAAVALGQAYERMGRSQEAAAAYQQALDARPGHPTAVAGLKRLGVAPR